MIERLGLGTVQFGLPYGVANQAGMPSAATVAQILKRAAAHRIGLLDTAIGYGQSETVLGQAGVAGFDIVTKLPAMPDGCPDVAAWVAAEVEASLRRLGIERLHAVLLHRPDQLLGPAGDALYAALQYLKSQGLTRKIGISVYAPDELDRLIPARRLDLVQAPLNILDQRLVTSGWAEKLKQKGIEIHARSIFLQGLLLMPDRRRPEKFARWADHWRCWSDWLQANRLTPLAACLGYLAGVAEIDRVLFGVDSVAQLDAIAAAAATRLTGLPDWPLPIDAALVNPAQWGDL